MSTQTRLLTADEFLVWPDEPGMRQELIRGEVVTMSLPGGRHGKVALKIGRLSAITSRPSEPRRYLRRRDGLYRRTRSRHGQGPDVSFVRSERLAAITKPEKHIPFAPDLAVEVLSPNDRDDEVEEKIQTWLKAGSLLVWLVDPESRTVVVYRPGAEPVTLREDQQIDGGDVIPGFHCRVADFFA